MLGRDLSDETKNAVDFGAEIVQLIGGSVKDRHQ